MTHLPFSARALQIGLFIAGVGLSNAALAQTTDAQKAAAAQALYEQATADMDAGRFASACPKLEQVLRLVPEGLGARLTLGDCYEGLGKLASAWSQYALVEAAAIKADRARVAAQKAAALKPKLSKLSFTIADRAKAIPSLAISRDDVALSQVEWETPLPVDAGKHTIVVTAPGYKPFKKEVDVAGNGMTVVVEISPLEPDPTPSATAPLVAPADRAPAVPLPLPLVPPLAPNPEPSWQRPFGVAAMGTGAVAAIAGAILGGLAIAKKGTSNGTGTGYCDAANVCGDTGLSLRRDALTLGNASTATFIASGVFLGSGFLLFRFGKPSEPPHSSASVSLTGLGVRGVW